MIDALIAGTLHRAAQSRMTSTGKPFATATVRVAVRDGSTVFVSVITFADAAVAALLALGAGDSVALTGGLTPKVYQPKDGGEPHPSLDLLAHAVLTEYHVARKRKVMQDAADGRNREVPFDDEHARHAQGAMSTPRPPGRHRSGQPWRRE